MSGSKNAVKVSRRSVRLFVEEQQPTEVGMAGIASRLTSESRYSSSDEKEKDKQRSETERQTPMTQTVQVPRVDLGKDVCGIFPVASNKKERQVSKYIRGAKCSTKAKVDGRPLNFGIVLPGNIYRSSFPKVEDFQFLQSLGLKSVVSLVKKDPFPLDFQEFMRQNGILHHVIDMKGTKKVRIPEDVMNSVMELVLSKENYPLLIHCNHGKHRTGCAVAVIRHVAGWNINGILEEYKGHAEPKIRDCDIQYITDYQVTGLQGLRRNILRKNSRFIVGNRMVKMLILTTILLSILFSTLIFW